MILKTIKSAPETIFIEEQFFPEVLAREMQNFKERNSLLVKEYTIHDRNPVHTCCPNCLKAFTIKKAKELGIPLDVVNQIRRIFRCGEGHNGYYLDKGTLKKA
jgi:hypothetical protein